MIRSYFSSIAGKSHIKRGINCQDYSDTVYVKDLCISCIADGVGSAIHSDIASKMAVTNVIEFLSKWYNNHDIDEREILLKINEAYSYSLNMLNEYINEGNFSELDYDTTIDCVVYFNNHIYLGHSGDGGIIGLDYNGKYHVLTKPQKGDDNISVIPFRLKDFWEFIKIDEPMCSVLLATDGVYDQIAIGEYKCFPIGIHIRLAELLMNLSDKGLNDELLDSYKNQVFNFLSNNDSINDDITVSVIYDDEVIPLKMPEDYYIAPNWDLIIKEKTSMLYTDLKEEIEEVKPKKKKVKK